MCGLGQTAANPVLSTLRYFRDEYERHIVDQRCDAFVCNELVGAPCQSACPVGTEAWRYVAHIARGEYEEAYQVIREANPFPSVCARVCDHPCEERCRAGTSGGEPVAIRALKRFVTDRVDPSAYVRRDERGRTASRPGWPSSAPGLPGSPRPTSCRWRAAGSRSSRRTTEPGGMLVLRHPVVPAAARGGPAGDRGAARRHHRRSAAAPRSAGTSPSTACSTDGYGRCCWPWAPTRAAARAGGRGRAGRLPVDRLPQGLQPARRAAGQGPGGGDRRRQLGDRRRAHRDAPARRRERHHPLPADARRDAGLRGGDRGRRSRRASISRPWSRPIRIGTTNGRLLAPRVRPQHARRAGLERPPAPGADRGQRVRARARHPDRGDQRGLRGRRDHPGARRRHRGHALATRSGSTRRPCRPAGPGCSRPATWSPDRTPSSTPSPPASGPRR